jgi:excisionase family DNA binding protein
MCDRLLTVKDLQAVFSCGKDKAYQLMHSSGFPTIQVGGRYYVRRDDLDRWLSAYTGRKYIL